MDLNASKAEKVYRDVVYVHVGGEWILKSRHVYSLAHPDYKWEKGDVFVFLDNDKRNFSPENVMKCTRGEMRIFYRLNKGVHDTEGGRLAFRQAQLRVAMLATAEKRGLVKHVNGRLQVCTENEDLQKILDSGKRYREEHKEDARRYHEEHKEDARRYYEEHKEDARRYREEHKEAIAEQTRRYREEHKEAIAERMRRYREEHKEDARRYREEHKEAIAERKRRYYEEHKKEINARRRANYKVKHGIQGILMF